MSEATLGSADVAIIGAGPRRLSTAYYLAKGGVDVAVIERGNINREASGANAGSLHLQIYIHPHFPDDWIDRIRPTIELIREAQKSWATMEERLGTDCGIRLGGGLWVAETPDEMKLIEKKVAAENALGVMSEIHDRAGILRLAPYLGEHVIGGSFLEGEGFANPLLVTPAHVNAARKHGARFFADAAVTRNHQEWQPLRHRDEQGPVQRWAGDRRGWSLDGVHRAYGGLNLPVTGSIGQVSVTEGAAKHHARPHAPTCGQGTDTQAVAARNLHYRWRLARPLRPAPRPEIAQPRTRSSGMPGSPPAPFRRSPQAQLVRAWGGMGSGSIDGLPIVGEFSVVRGFHVAYVPLGFTMGPIVGQIFSEKFLTGEASLPLAPYAPDRFLDRAA